MPKARVTTTPRAFALCAVGLSTGLGLGPTSGPTTRSDRRVDLRMLGLDREGELLAGQAGGGIPGTPLEGCL
jgi:hypothetical protein